MQIKDRVFIVTGASSGIGLSTAAALADRDAKVALLARTKEALEKLSAQLSDSFPIVADMTDFKAARQAVRAVHDHYGRIDGLVNNAGRSYAAPVEEIEPVLFDEIFHLNVFGADCRHAGRYSRDAFTGCGKHRKCELRNGIHGTARIQRLLLFQ